MKQASWAPRGCFGQTLLWRLGAPPPGLWAFRGGPIKPMAHFPRWGMCWSPPNLTSFLTWFRDYASVDEQAAALQLHIVNHRQACSPILLACGITPEELPVLVRYQGQSVPLPVTDCTEPNCHRCITGSGGYQWRWLDQRWTPQAARDLTLTPEQLQQEIYRPWPVGMLISHSALPPSASYAVTAEAMLGAQAWVLSAAPEPPSQSAASGTETVCLPKSACSCFMESLGLCS